MKNQVTKKFFADPGHGWLSVKITDLIFLGIQNEISSCSYMRGESAYLEEDCDAGRFLQAAQNRGIQVTIKDSHTNNRSPIRSYDRYDPRMVARFSTYLQSGGVAV